MNNQSFQLRVVVIVFFTLAAAACGHPETSKAEHLARAQQYLQAERYAEARIEFRSALQLDRNLAAAHYGLGESSLALGAWQEAAEQFQLAVRFDPANLDARVRLGNLLLQNTRAGRSHDEAVKEAERLADEVLQKQSHHVAGLVLLSNVRSAQKRWDDARAELLRAIELNPASVEARLALARHYERRARALPNRAREFNAQAEAAFQQALARNPQAAEARLAYGDFLYADRRAPAAERQLLQAFAAKPQDKLVLTALRRFYENQFRYDEAEKYLALQTALEPEKLAGRAQLIDLHARAGRTEQAITEYRQLLAEQPQFLRGYARLAELLLERGDLAAAKSQIDEALKRSRQDTDALLVRGRIRTLEGQLRDALIDLEQALKLEPALPAALYYTADAYLQYGDPVRARTLVNSLLGQYPGHPLGRLMLIRIQLHQGKAAEAVVTANQILAGVAALRTNDAARQTARLPAESLTDLESKAYTSRAVARMQLRDFAAARADLETALKIDPRAVEPHLNLATIHFYRNDLAAAERAAERAVALGPNDNTAVTTAVDVYLARHNFKAAHDRLDALLAANPKRSLLLDQKARVFDEQGDVVNAESTWRRVIDDDPAYLNAYFALSDFYQRSNQVERALNELRGVTQQRTGRAQQLAQAHLFIGILEEERGHYDVAVRGYESTLSFDARSNVAAIALNNLAWLFADRKLGNLDKAADHAQRAIAITPEAGFFDTLGYVYFQKGQFAVAAEQFGKAIDRKPTNATYHLHLARALRDNHAADKARQAYERALQLGGAQFAEASAARQELAVLPRW